MSYADVLSLFPLPVFSSVLEDVDGEKIYKNLELEKFNETSQAQSQEDSTNTYITEDLYLLEKYPELKNSIERGRARGVLIREWELIRTFTVPKLVILAHFGHAKI